MKYITNRLKAVRDFIISPPRGRWRGVIVFVFALIAIDQLGGRALDALRDHIYAMHPTADKTHYLANNIDADIVIMGASAASCAYDARQIADSTGMTVYNAAMSGHFFEYQCCALRLMLEHHTPKYILWEIGEFAFSDVFANMDYNDALDIYPYYEESRSQRVEESKSQRGGATEYVRSYIDRKDEWQKLRMMSRLYRHNGKIANYMAILLSPSKEEQGGLGFEPLPATGYEYPTLREDAGSAEKYNATFSQARYDTIANTIRYCQEKGVKVIITSAPRFTKAKLHDLLLFRKIVQLANECGCPYIDFMLTDEFIKDNTLFHENDHMNSQGAALYMTMFIPELKEILQ